MEVVVSYERGTSVPTHPDTASLDYGPWPPSPEEPNRLLVFHEHFITSQFALTQLTLEQNRLKIRTGY
jgi:hypothetical protein